jgi:hypothetical protein
MRWKCIKLLDGENSTPYQVEDDKQYSTRLHKYDTKLVMYCHIDLNTGTIINEQLTVPSLEGQPTADARCPIPVPKQIKKAHISEDSESKRAEYLNLKDLN